MNLSGNSTKLALAAAALYAAYRFAPHPVIKTAAVAVGAVVAAKQLPVVQDLLA
jgi:hypothetical protein